MSAWDDLQDAAVSRLISAIDSGGRRICFTGPTGFGKSRCAEKLIRRYLEVGLPVVMYTNRRALVQQLSGVMEQARIPHGVRAAGYESDHDALFQIASIQTEGSRVLKRKRLALHNATVALVDECHLQTGEQASEIINRHVEAGCAVVGVTATPLGLSEHYHHLVCAASVSDCFRVGALVPAIHYAPDEPDLKAFKKAQKAAKKRVAEGSDWTEAQVTEAMGPRPELFGRIWDNFEKLNPEHKPTICFGPDVGGSIFIAQQFTQRGVRAAHIDGEHIWLDGELHRTTDALRQEVLDESKAGKIVVLGNRFVLREGIDCPWLQHGILATVFGSLQSYLQSVGRLLRAYEGISHVTISDHGGNWWRHGSANSDREWRLDFTSEMVYDLRANRIRDGREKEPFLCPGCGRVWVSGDTCNPARGGCGFVLKSAKRARLVVTSDGELREIEDSLFPKRRICKRADGASLWERMYWRARSEKWNGTFKEAIGLFAHECHSWPDPSWPFYPTNEFDLYRKVKDVPLDRLVPKHSEAA